MSSFAPQALLSVRELRGCRSPSRVIRGKGGSPEESRMSSSAPSTPPAANCRSRLTLPRMPQSVDVWVVSPYTWASADNEAGARQYSFGVAAAAAAPDGLSRETCARLARFWSVVGFVRKIFRYSCVGGLPSCRDCRPDVGVVYCQQLFPG